MFKSFYREKVIKDKLSGVSEIYPQLYNLLLEKIEFGRYTRIKKTIRQSVRKIFAMGIKEYLREFLSEDVIYRINTPSKKKKILFIAGLTANIVGISIYLRKTGEFETILLIENPWLIKFYEQYFDTVYIYNSYYEVAGILNVSSPYIIHAHGASCYYFLGVIAQCLNKAVIVIGFVDPPSFETGANSLEELRKKPKDTQLDCFSEEFLFNKEDGIILTANTLAAGKKLLHQYNLNRQILEFPPYVCDEFFEEEEKYSKKTDKIYLIYGGVVAPSNKPKELLGYVQFIDLARNLTDQGFCFHIYVSPHYSPVQTKKLFSDYGRLAEKIPGFVFKQGIPLDVAIKEFSRYDFAVIINKFDEVDEKKVNMFHWHTSIPSKFFTYLSAGLPVIVSEENDYIASLVKKYEIGIVISQNEIDLLSEIIKKYDYEKLKINVKQAREDLSMKKNIGRLIDFYEQAAAVKKLSENTAHNV